MKLLLRLEEVGLLGLSIGLFARLEYAWWVYPVLLLSPDLSVLGYLAGPRIGAATYNLLHHRGLAAAAYLLGAAMALPALALAGLIILGHSSLDRVFGYGLKYPDSFRHTHLGVIGRG
ncbi:MAG: DUF4260 domain-containing protein [Anaerolineales bacterium]